MTGRNPDGISPDCSDVPYGPQRLNAIIGAYEAFLDPVCGTDDLSFYLVLELSATKTPSARRHPPGAELDDLVVSPSRPVNDRPRAESAGNPSTG
jgi:hypothetical protein